MDVIQHVIEDVKYITYVSDVEGHWDYFIKFVELSKGIKWEVPDVEHRLSGKDLELTLTEDYHFVFGGDACDKGLGTLRFLEAMVRLKQKSPAFVHLLQGNRDINKIRFTSELHPDELAKAKSTPHAYWVKPGSQTYWQFLTQLAEKNGHSPADEAGSEAVILSEFNTKVNKLLYMLAADMGSAGEFEFRRQELALIKKVDTKDICDQEVLQSYEDSVKPEGWLTQYLKHSQLALKLGSTLIVHGQIIGNGFPQNQVRGADEQNTAWTVTSVPDEKEPTYDLCQWIVKLNTWGAKQISEWEETPQWAQSPTDSSYEGWSHRGGAEMIAYGCPGTRVPTVVYCRYLEANSMPKAYPQDLVDYLKEQNVTHVVVGHTPHGNAPTVIRHPPDGVVVIMADTSFSHNAADRYYKGDNRGVAVCDICIKTTGEGTDCEVDGQTQTEDQISFIISQSAKGDQFVGRLVPPATNQYFVKAKIKQENDLPETYIINSINGYAYDYVTICEQGLEAFEGGKSLEEAVHVCEDLQTTKRIYSNNDILPQRTYSHGELEHGFDTETDKEKLKDMILQQRKSIPKEEVLYLVCSEEVCGSFRGEIDFLKMLELADNKTGKNEVDREDFWKACHRIPDANATWKTSLLFFPLCSDSEHGENSPESAQQFPDGVGPFNLTPTSNIKVDDIKLAKQCAKGNSGKESWHQYGRLIQMKAGQLSRNGDLGRIVEQLPKERAELNGFISPLHGITLSNKRRQEASIPEEATHFAFSYPFKDDWETIMKKAGVAGVDPEKGEALCPDVAFLQMGGYIYFQEGEDTFKPLQINALTLKGDQLYFSKPKTYSMDEAEFSDFSHMTVFHAVTIRQLLKRGATYFCWVPPPGGSGEMKKWDKMIGNEHGGFLYIMKEKTERPEPISEDNGSERGLVAVDVSSDML